MKYSTGSDFTVSSNRLKGIIASDSTHQSECYPNMESGKTDVTFSQAVPGTMGACWSSDNSIVVCDYTAVKSITLNIQADSGTVKITDLWFE